MSKFSCSSFPPGHGETYNPDHNQNDFARGDNRLCVHKRLQSPRSRPNDEAPRVRFYQSRPLTRS